MDIMNDTTLDDYYEATSLTLNEALAVVRYKLIHNKEPVGAKEELAMQFIKQWSEYFGAQTALE